MELFEFLLRLNVFLIFCRKYFEEESESDEEMEDLDSKQPNPNAKRIAEDKKDMLIAYFLMSIIWSIGAVLKQSSRDKFTQFFISLCDGNVKKYPK